MAAPTAGKLMISRPAKIRADATTAEAACLMSPPPGHIRSCRPTRRGRLIGIVSQDDILGTFTRPDQSIQHEVAVDLILHDFALNPQAFTVTVRQGIVTLAGHPETDEVAHSLAAAVRQVEGVIAVRDQLSYQAQRG